jgi:hypothetical protein
MSPPARAGEMGVFPRGIRTFRRLGQILGDVLGVTRGGRSKSFKYRLTGEAVSL